MIGIELERTARRSFGRLRDHVRFLLELFSDAARHFSENEGFRLVAAFSYYLTFSIFPLLLLAITVVGFILGDSDAARAQLLDAIASEGTPVHEVLDRSLSALQESRGVRGLSATVGLVTLVFSASGAFVEFDASLNRIWCVPRKNANGVVESLRQMLRDRLMGFAIVAAVGLTLLLSLVASSLLAAFVGRARSEIDIALWPGIVRTATLVLTIVVLAVLFTVAFHLVPRTRPPVRAVAGGAVLTSVLLTALRELFASYLSNLTSYSAYGVAGGVLALATYIYMSSVVIFFGAQLTRVHAEKLGAVPPCSRES